MSKGVSSRFEHFPGTGKKNAVACRGLPTNFAEKHVFESKVGTAQQHCLCKYRKNA